MLGPLVPCRRRFYRTAALRAEPVTAQWVTAAVLVVASATWLLVFAWRHVEYAHEPWWQFELDARVSRAFRAAVAMSDWLDSRPRSDALPLAPELARLRGIPVLCIYGRDEADSLCPTLADGVAERVALPGGHHFGGDYDIVVRRIIAAAVGGRGAPQAGDRAPTSSAEPSPRTAGPRSGRRSH